ncbi:sporulation protein YqfD [Clostridium sp.]|uniref:sporulation protein YqfD n=1 Tax=Clostridium sp. TaxID=1506 RepID=UPI002636A061|nr:sporulation protein YqfD [Clostridium sp.]
MNESIFDTGKLVVEINVLNPERILNILWNENVKIINIKRVDVATIRVTIDYKDYNILKSSVKRLNGKSKIIGRRGLAFLLSRIKRNVFLVIGSFIFITILFYLSNYVWRIEINTRKNVSPYELRQQLYFLGVKPGIKKKKVNGKEIEKQIENLNGDILWSRARVEGSTLKIYVEEKINPPTIKSAAKGNLVAKIDGEVSRVYTFRGRSAVHIGDIIKVGDVLIEGINGSLEEPYEVAPEGVVMANTFYEKSMVTTIDGKKLQRTGDVDKDIYLKLFDKKIYIKKAIKDFEVYDKIEETSKMLNKVIYFEKEEVEVKLRKEEAIESAVKELQESLYNNLTREAKIKDKVITINNENEEQIKVNVVFIVEQNIVNNIPIGY